MLAEHDVAQRTVGADDAARQGHGRHADGGLLEDLAEPFEVLVEHALVVTRLCCGMLLLRRVRHRLENRRGRTGWDPGQDLDESGRHLGDGNGLLEQRRRPELEGPRSESVAVEPRVDHHVGRRRDREDARQRIESVHRGHRHVEQQQVRPVLMGQADRLDPVGAVADHGEQARQPELGLQQLSHLGRVVDEDDRRSVVAHDRNYVRMSGNPRPQRALRCTPCRLP